MPEMNMREYVTWLYGQALQEEAWANSLGFENAEAYHAEMDDHYDNIRYNEELDARA